MSSRLFEPIAIGEVQLPNRLVVAPMCQYSASDGSATDWHLQHLSQLAYSGAGLVVVEATAVERRGRITHACLGLYSDENEAALERALHAARRLGGPTRFGIQLAHAGRKASTHRPWQGGAPLGPAEDPWQTVSSSATPFGDGWHVPRALSSAEIDATVESFVQSALRAVRIGFEVIEIHSAHGYLLHEFLSPLVNSRTDDYGGSLENRLRMPLAVIRAVRAAVAARRRGGLAHFRDRLGRRRLGRQAVDRVCAGCEGARHRVRLRVQRRRSREGHGPGRAGLPGSARTRSAASDRCTDSGRRAHYGSATGRTDPRSRLGRHDGVGACVPRRSTLGMARGGHARRESALPGAVSPRAQRRLAPHSRSDRGERLRSSRLLRLLPRAPHDARVGARRCRYMIQPVIANTGIARLAIRNTITPTKPK